MQWPSHCQVGMTTSLSEDSFYITEAGGHSIPSNSLPCMVWVRVCQRESNVSFVQMKEIEVIMIRGDCLCMVGQEEESQWLFRECWRPRCFAGVDRDSGWGRVEVFISSWILEQISVGLLCNHPYYWDGLVDSSVCFPAFW